MDSKISFTLILQSQYKLSNKYSASTKLGNNNNNRDHNHSNNNLDEEVVVVDTSLLLKFLIMKLLCELLEYEILRRKELRILS